MGTWGTSIFQNDVSVDVKLAYESKLKAGLDDETAYEEILKQFDSELNDSDDSTDVIFALAITMWKYGRLVDEIRDRAISSIEKDLSLDKWDTPKIRKTRQAHLEKMKEQLMGEMPARKKVSVHKPVKLGWKKGEVYCFQIKKNPNDKWQSDDCIGWYALFYIDNIILEDWNVKGVYDEVAEAYFFLQKDRPTSAEDIYSATQVCFLKGGIDSVGNFMGNQYKVEILEKSKTKRPKDLALLGMIDSYKVKVKEHRNIGCFFWDLCERMIVWGYNSQLQFEQEHNQLDKDI